MSRLLIGLLLIFFFHKASGEDWIRINLLGYRPGGLKIAVWCSKENKSLTGFQIVDAVTQRVVFEGMAGKPYGSYGPFVQTYRLNFSTFGKPGKYFLRTGKAISPIFEINDDVYKGTADFSLQYMRQQRSGYNPYLKDSCHTRDGYTLYGPMPDSTHLNVSGGWHDATDYLQYSMTSANATYHLLASYRDFPDVFKDKYGANGLAGSNGVADIFDEAKWGLDWLLKMHPRPEWMFNQLADDRDHQGFRLPNKDTASYGKGQERPIYFVTGEPQGMGKYKNRTTGTSSAAGRFSSAFALGYQLFKGRDEVYAQLLKSRAASAYAFGLKKPGNTQTACLREPYFYEEDNWVDDMELAAAQLFNVTNDESFLKASFEFAGMEKQTPWLGKDTASHYQWYPFINVGHFELAHAAKGEMRNAAIEYYRKGIEMVWNKGRNNAFYRGVPFIWCSNNLQASFAIQCYWYRKLSGDETFAELEQTAFDWLLGCNPWGTSMIIGMPSTGDYPDDPHSSFNFLNGYQTLGSLVDGPVYGSIFKTQRGVTIARGDEYAPFQSTYVVYHDDYADYVTNEPTMDGTASLIYLLAAKESETFNNKKLTFDHGAITRGDSTRKEMALVFTGDGFADGGGFISKALKEKKIKASFFLTGNFYRNAAFQTLLKELRQEGHYLGPHSDKHLLYCDWIKRDSLLVTKKEFQSDLLANYSGMQKIGISKNETRFFMPPYEWYNDSIASWTRELGLQLINYTPGTISHTDYTTPDMKNYRATGEIYASVERFAKQNPSGLNGFILLVHIGTDPARTDKFYRRLPQLLDYLRLENYKFVRIDELLSP